MDISKLDAAKRQIETAILLYFKSKDPVSTHTLASAWRQLLYDISKDDIKIESVFDKLLETVKPENKKYAIEQITKAKNFFKHGKEDQDQILKWNPEQSEWELRDAIWMYIQITKENTEYMKLYNLRRLISHADIVADEYKEQLNLWIKKAKDLWILYNKEKFFNEMLPLVHDF